MTSNPLMLEFGQHCILKEDQIKRLRNYIAQKYTRALKQERAQILAHAIHTILDREINAPSLSSFVDCLEVKVRILQRALMQPTFSITGSDLLEGLLSVDTKSSKAAYRDFVATWCASFVAKKQIQNLLNLDISGLSHQWNFREPLVLAELPLVLGELPLPPSHVPLPQVIFDRSKAYTKSSTLLKMGLTVALAFGIACNFPVTTPPSASPTMDPQKNYIAESILNQVISPQKSDQYFLYQPQAHYANLYPKLNFVPLQIRPVSLWLLSKDSLLAKRDYLNTLDQISQQYNVDPYLLLAIIGQEQGFVPLAHPSSEKIILNPFNVFGSWQTYHPGFKVSCTIAAHTISKALKSCPPQSDPFLWLNKTYAEDPNWHLGVEKIYYHIIKSVTPSPQI